MMNKKFATILLVILCVLPFAITAAGLTFLPEQVPMHYDFAGNVDRWGSKYENYVLAAVFSAAGILLLLISKVTVKLADTDEERVKAKSNENVVLYTGIGMMLLFCAMQTMFMIADYRSTVLGMEPTAAPVWKIVGIGMGILFIFIGNFMPKAKKNSAVGVRTPWSMSSDLAWSKSQRFGGIVFAAAGVVLCVLSVVISGIAVLWLLLADVLTAAAITVYYSYKVSCTVSGKK